MYVCVPFLTRVFLGNATHCIKYRQRLLVLLWSLLKKDCLLSSKTCCCMDTLPTTALHSVVQGVQQLSMGTLDNGSLVLQKSKDKLSESSWGFEPFVWQNLLYSVSPNQMTNQ